LDKNQLPQPFGWGNFLHSGLLEGYQEPAQIWIAIGVGAGRYGYIRYGRSAVRHVDGVVYVGFHQEIRIAVSQFGFKPGENVFFTIFPVYDDLSPRYLLTFRIDYYYL
jgi:hypothetical protein